MAQQLRKLAVALRRAHSNAACEKTSARNARAMSSTNALRLSRIYSTFATINCSTYLHARHIPNIETRKTRGVLTRCHVARAHRCANISDLHSSVLVRYLVEAAHTERCVKCSLDYRHLIFSVRRRNCLLSELNKPVEAVPRTFQTRVRRLQCAFRALSPERECGTHLSYM